MRIRKNTKLSSMLLTTTGYGGEIPETYVCHLNQSPWDVIPVISSDDGDGAAELTNLLDSFWFLPSPLSSSPPLIPQFDGEDSFNGKMSLGDSNGASERLNSSIENHGGLVSVERRNLIPAGDNYESSPEVEDPMDLSYNSDKKTRTVEPKSPGDDEQVGITMPERPKRGRPRSTAKKAPATTAASKNPYEFYYYSGFGPRWGRKRGGSGDEKVMDEKSWENNMSKKSNSSSDEEDDKTAAFGEGSSSFEYVEENYNLMDQESDHGKKKTKKMKRGRKPVKERSLKSLM